MKKIYKRNLIVWTIIFWIGAFINFAENEVDLTATYFIFIAVGGMIMAFTAAIEDNK